MYGTGSHPNMFIELHKHGMKNMLCTSCVVAFVLLFVSGVLRLPDMLIRRKTTMERNVAMTHAMNEDASKNLSYTMLHDDDSDLSLAYQIIVTDMHDASESTVTHKERFGGSHYDAFPCLCVTDSMREAIGLDGVTSADVLNLVEEAMLDDPTLAIGTCGQALAIDIVDSSYDIRIIDDLNESDQRDDDNSIREEVTAANVAADGIAKSVEAFACTNPNLKDQVNIAYALLASRCSYADGMNDTVHSNDAYGCLVEGESKCYGMAGAMCMVLNRLGVPNVVVCGTLANGVEHAVDLAWIGGGWQALDVTMLNNKRYDKILAKCNDPDNCVGITPYTQYKDATGFEPDADCAELMSRYSTMMSTRHSASQEAIAGM